MSDTKREYRGIFPGVKLRDKIAWIFSELAEEEPAYRNVIEALILYPYLKWSCVGYSLNDIIISQSKEIYELTRTVSDTTEIENTLQLDRRGKYYNLVFPFREEITKLPEWISTYGPKGHHFQSCLMTVLGETDEPCTAYVLEKYLPGAVEVLYRFKRMEIEELFLPLMDFIRSQKSDKNSDLYHNVKELLTKYEELRYSQEDVDAFIYRILACKTLQDVLDVTTNLNDVISASHINQFLSIIAAAMPLLLNYPGNGKKFYEIVTRLTENRYVPARGRTTRRKTDKEVGKELLMKKANFSRRKREAFETYGMILWGVDRTILVKTGILED